MGFVDELKRRNVFRVGIAYAVSAWLVLQVVDLVIEHIVAPDWVMDVLILLIVLGFVISLVVAWAYEVTPEGIKRDADVARDASITNQTARRLDIITLATVPMKGYSASPSCPSTASRTIRPTPISPGASTETC